MTLPIVHVLYGIIPLDVISDVEALKNHSELQERQCLSEPVKFIWMKVTLSAI